MDLGPDSEGSAPRYDPHCVDVPVSGAPTTGTLDSAPTTGGTLFFIFLNAYIVYKRIFKNVNNKKLIE